MIRFIVSIALAAILTVAAAGEASAQGAITAQLEPVGGSGVRGTVTVEPPVAAYPP